MPKMIKIGEIRVLIYFDLPWNEPYGYINLEKWNRNLGIYKTTELNIPRLRKQ